MLCSPPIDGILEVPHCMRGGCRSDSRQPGCHAGFAAHGNDSTNQDKEIDMSPSSVTRGLATLCIAAALLLGLPGCQTYREGGSRTVGEVTDDVAIQTAVKSRLLADTTVSGLRIQTEVYRGVVTLHGRVPDELSRRHALRIAEEVKGVVRVDDRLTIVTE